MSTRSNVVADWLLSNSYDIVNALNSAGVKGTFFVSELVVNNAAFLFSDSYFPVSPDGNNCT